MYSSSYNSSGLDALGGIVGGAIAVLIVLGLIMLAVVVFYLISLWKVFKKAGKNGWEAIVPFYNSWVLVEISGLNWWYFLLMISSTIAALLGIETLGVLCYLANIVATFFCSFNLAKKFHKDIGYAILLTLFPIVMMPILGFSNSCQYDSSVPVSPNGPIENGPNQVNANNQAASNQTGNKFCTSCGTKVSSSEKFCTNCGKKLD